MERNSQQATSQWLAIGLSIVLHLLLLLAGYYTAIRQSANISTGYSITLTAIASQQPPVTTVNKTSPPKPKKATLQKPTPPPHKPVASASPEKLPVERKSVPTESTTPPAQEANTVDERGLYQTQPGTQAGVKLDLDGWMWDTAPKPKDDTEESGRIVFEIKIDELGEIVAVKTLEKTVSPLVEKLYKDALTELTFSRTSDNIAYAPVYTGKVTFVLRTK